MAILREYVMPFLILLVFVLSLVAVSARIFLPSDMAAPAPVEEIQSQPSQALMLPVHSRLNVLG